MIVSQIIALIPLVTGGAEALLPLIAALRVNRVLTDAEVDQIRIKGQISDAAYDTELERAKAGLP